MAPVIGKRSEPIWVSVNAALETTVARDSGANLVSAEWLIHETVYQRRITSRTGL